MDTPAFCNPLSRNDHFISNRLQRYNFLRIYASFFKTFCGFPLSCHPITKNAPSGSPFLGSYAGFYPASHSPLLSFPPSHHSRPLFRPRRCFAEPPCPSPAFLSYGERNKAPGWLGESPGGILRTWYLCPLNVPSSLKLPIIKIGLCLSWQLCGILSRHSMDKVLPARTGGQKKRGRSLFFI